MLRSTRRSRRRDSNRALPQSATNRPAAGRRIWPTPSPAIRRSGRTWWRARAPSLIDERTELELDVELFQLFGLGLGRLDPFLHVRQRHDRLAIGGADGVELDVVGHKARALRREQGARHTGLFAEQERAAGLRNTFAPDRRDAVDIGLCAKPDLEAGIMRLEIHRQRRAHVAEAGMHLAGDRAAAGAGGLVL